jgi:FkbM family methyltransferase
MGTFTLRPGTTDFQFTNFSYETAIKKYLLRKGKDIGLFIDIGACIGEYAIWLGKQGIPCIAIEPVNHAAIMENIALNTIAPGQIKVLNCAVGSDNKKVSFEVLEGVTSSSYMNEDDTGGDIDCRRLDDIIDLGRYDTSKPVVIKLDVEGMEIEALKGAERLIKQAPKLEIVYEYCSCGDMAIRAVLDQYARFTYRDLDGVNTLAVKQ